MVVTLGQQNNVREKPTVILYTYVIINRHAGPPNNTKPKTMQYITIKKEVIIYDNDAIEPYKKCHEEVLYLQPNRSHLNVLTFPP